jgi:hypothetical protein
MTRLRATKDSHPSESAPAIRHVARKAKRALARKSSTGRGAVIDLEIVLWPCSHQRAPDRFRSDEVLVGADEPDGLIPWIRPAFRPIGYFVTDGVVVVVLSFVLKLANHRQTGSREFSPVLGRTERP